MPLFETPKFNPTSYAMLDIAEPGKGGINQYELEFEQDVNQTPFCQNMMYSPIYPTYNAKFLSMFFIPFAF